VNFKALEPASGPLEPGRLSQCASLAAGPHRRGARVESPHRRGAQGKPLRASPSDACRTTGCSTWWTDPRSVPEPEPIPRRRARRWSRSAQAETSASSG